MSTLSLLVAREVVITTTNVEEVPRWVVVMPTLSSLVVTGTRGCHNDNIRCHEKVDIATTLCFHRWSSLYGLVLPHSRLFHSLRGQPQRQTRWGCASDCLWPMQKRWKFPPITRGLPTIFWLCRFVQFIFRLANHTSDDTSPSQATSHTPLSVPQPPGQDCGTV